MMNRERRKVNVSTTIPATSTTTRRPVYGKGDNNNENHYDCSHSSRSNGRTSKSITQQLQTHIKESCSWLQKLVKDGGTRTSTIYQTIKGYATTVGNITKGRHRVLMESITDGSNNTMRYQAKQIILVASILVLSLWLYYDIVSTQTNENVSMSTNLVDISNLVVDVISIGSLLKPDYHEAQHRTFAQHRAIRNFYTITEKNDTDKTCFTNLNTKQLNSIIKFCATTEHQSYISTTLRKNLFHPKRHSGWMCMQKRPLDGLYQVLEKYKKNETTIPDYLFLIEDDTFLNMNPLLMDLAKYYPTAEPFAIAGCIRNVEESKSGITFPEGGFGSFFTRRAIERFLQPIYCDGRDQHSHIGCWRLNLNALEEREYYTEGMSVHELMHAFTSAHSFTAVQKWSKAGYCMHADHALAFFTNFYHIPVPDGLLKKGEPPKDKIRRKFSYTGLLGQRDTTECDNQHENCTINARICNDVTPKQMDQLFGEKQDPQQ